MRVDIAKLKGAIVANGMTQEQLAKEIGVDSSTLSRKMQLFGATFTIGEIRFKVVFFGSSRHFFSQRLAKMRVGETFGRRGEVKPSEQ